METITLQENKKIYFSSDNHLGLPGKVKSLKREKIFIKWLDTIKNDAQVIFLLGDLFDFWFEFKKVVPKGYTRLFGKLAELTDAGVKIYFFVGNHDAWMRNYFKKELGIDIFFEPQKFKINSKKFFIGHGDGLGPGDYGYKFLKLIFRNSFFKFLFSCIHPDISIRIGEYLSRKNSVISGKEIKFESNEKELLFNYCKKILKEDSIINFKESAEKISARFRAYNEWPGICFIHNNTFIKIQGLAISSNKSPGYPGEIISFNRSGLTIKTVDYDIVITHFQFPNKNIITAEDAFNSYRHFFT